jgi:putative oxidoreductase
VVGILLAGLCSVTLLRVSGVYDFYLINIPIIAVLLLLFVAFILFSRDHYTLQEATLAFIRMYLGFDIAAHAAEKLFGGIMPFDQVVQAFTNLHVPMPVFFVALAGLCEFGAAIALGLGLFTRLGAVCTAVYLLVATMLGNHFSLGFIWANAGGGWEYPVLWIVFTLVFAVTGSGKFSFDDLIRQHRALP